MCDIARADGNRTASGTTSAGLLNVRSVRQKAALIHDVIADYRLDVLVLTETWIPSDATHQAVPVCTFPVLIGRSTA